MNPKPNHLKMKHAVTGVTLIELMVTIAVLAIVLGIGVPSFQDLIRQNRLSSGVNEVLSGVVSVRSEAIKLNSTRRFCMDDSTLKWDMRTLEATPTISREGSISAGIGVEAKNLGTEYTAGLKCIDYHSDGLPYEAETAVKTTSNLITNGSLALTLGSTTKTVHVKTGSVYVK